LASASAEAGWEAARIRRHLLSLDNRQRLVDHVERHPGIHLRRLARDLGLAIGTTEHHLHLLVRHGILERHDQGGHAAYFVQGTCPVAERRLLCVLRGDTPRRLLRALAADPDLGTAALSVRLGVSRSAVAHHLAKLVGEGLVERLRVGRGSLLQVRDPAALAQALAAYDRQHPVAPWPGLKAERAAPVPPASPPSLAPAPASSPVAPLIQRSLPLPSEPAPGLVRDPSNDCPPVPAALAELAAEAVRP
jgi:DNA-binding transcriptional ArsR family regulator